MSKFILKLLTNNSFVYKYLPLNFKNKNLKQSKINNNFFKSKYIDYDEYLTNDTAAIFKKFIDIFSFATTCYIDRFSIQKI